MKICFMRNKSSNILSNNLRKRDKGRFKENRDKDWESEREKFSSREKIYFMGSKSRDILSIYLRKCDKERQKERNRVRKWKRGILKPWTDMFHRKWVECYIIVY